ncbi:hypothetical protein TVAGG3_0773950 [Trichomonas vaginalis G3]|uniref:hypothetical protein n=1 Tax=Trichomonas vaginalis (strain ATCC PRA-98 / G3) TaxID=412133 RepID=UPI0021E583F8|nr:hypothetical protein TVAGG3_0773950 [Trichomonas vaginalis G3]KAI5514021.1 hypothetical protein TVAGG3_0773950 [Trichomonas vaginalis G3]
MEILHVWGFYISGSMIVFALKSLLNDRTCSLKPNSVSGHTFYNIFFIIASWVLFRSDKEQKPFYLFILLLALNFSLCANIVVTYVGGYHSIRQMLYGGVSSIIVYLLYHLVSKLRQTWNMLTILGLSILITTFFGLFIGGNISFMGYSPVILWYICFLLLLKKAKTT